jgi:FtsP/CotA-like multicopper oxidase with cupredoxin domain
MKDVVSVQPRTKTEVELIAANPGPSLFHCHMQLHMDYGFMAMMEYVDAPGRGASSIPRR